MVLTIVEKDRGQLAETLKPRNQHCVVIKAGVDCLFIKHNRILKLSSPLMWILYLETRVPVIGAMSLIDWFR